MAWMIGITITACGIAAFTSFWAWGRGKQLKSEKALHAKQRIAWSDSISSLRKKNASLIRNHRAAHRRSDQFAKTVRNLRDQCNNLTSQLRQATKLITAIKLSREAESEALESEVRRLRRIAEERGVDPDSESDSIVSFAATFEDLLSKDAVATVFAIRIHDYDAVARDVPRTKILRKLRAMACALRNVKNMLSISYFRGALLVLLSETNSSDACMRMINIRDIVTQALSDLRTGEDAESISIGGTLCMPSMDMSIDEHVERPINSLAHATAGDGLAFTGIEDVATFLASLTPKKVVSLDDQRKKQ